MQNFEGFAASGAARKIGWLLLIIGLLLIVVPLVQTGLIITGHLAAPQVFKTIQLPQNPNPGFDVQKQVQNALLSILPLDLINSVLNLASWFLLLWIFMIGGNYLANLGIKLIRPTA